MRINDRGLALIKSFEKCRLSAYMPTPEDRPTIGWGATGKDIKLGLTWTQEQCDERLKADIAWREESLTKLLGDTPTTSDQFSAMLSLVYNIGFGDPARNIPGLITSSVLRRHKLGNHIGAANAFLMWNRQKGKILPGLTRRREVERKLYLSLPC